MDPHDATVPGTSLEDSFEAFRARGDATALARVFDATAPELLAVARYLVRRESEAEDLVQATFLTVIERRDAFDSTRSLLPWMLGILATLARRSRTDPRDGGTASGSRASSGDVAEPADTNAGPDAVARTNELQSAVQRAIANLPDVYARVLSLHLAEDLAPREIAARIDVEPGTVRVQIHRGLKLLRESLPPGFAGMAVATGGGIGIATLRENVLREGVRLLPRAGTAATSTATTSTVTTSTATTNTVSHVLLALASVVVLAGGTIAYLASKGETHGSEVASSVPPASMNQAAVIRPAKEPLEPLAPASPDRASQRVGQVAQAAGTAPTVETGPSARFIGHLVLPDGSPAVGASIQLRGTKGSDDRVRAFGAPASWQDPDALVTDAAGGFDIHVVPPRAFAFALEANLAGYAPLRWYWNEIQGEVVDVGQVKFDPACTLAVRIVDGSGTPRTDPYEVHVRTPDARNAAPRITIPRDLVFDPARQAYVSAELPAGRVRITVHAVLGDWLPETSVELLPSRVTQQDIVDRGAPAGSRIAVLAQTRPFHTFQPDALHILLLRDGHEPMRAIALERTPSTFVFDGLDQGAYDVVIDDPKFVRWTQSGVRTGQLVKAKLEGSATLAVRVEDGDTHAPTDDYRLSIDWPGANWAPSLVALHAPLAPLKDGLLSVPIVPGNWELVFEPRGHATQRLSLGTIKSGEVRALTLVSGEGATLRGRVLGAAGEGRAGVRVELTTGSSPGLGTTESGTSYFSSGGDVLPRVTSWAESASDGTFAFTHLTPGPNSVRAVFAPALATTRTVDMSAGATVEIELVEPAGGFVEGDVLLPAGSPTEDLLLMVSALGLSSKLDRFVIGQMRAGVQPASVGGHFRIGPLPVASVTVSLLMNAHTAESSTEGMPICDIARVVVEAGKTTRCDFDARATMPATARTRVYVDGAPANSGCVRVITANETDTRLFHLRLEGDIPLTIAPGSARIQVQDACDGKQDSWAWVHPDVLVLAPGQQTKLELRIDLVERDAHVSSSPAGTLLADHDVEVVTGLAPFEVVARVHTNEHGSVHLRLPVGPVTFRDPSSARRRRFEWPAATSGAIDVALAAGD